MTAPTLVHLENFNIASYVAGDEQSLLAVRVSMLFNVSDDPPTLL